MDHRTNQDTPLSTIALVAFSASCAGLLLVLVVYISSTPGFWQSLTQGVAAGYLLRQLVFNGLPVVFATNLAAFLLHARLGARRAPGRPALLALALDAPIRIGLFLALHAGIYAAAARLFGSFGGDVGQALAAVGPTIADAARFGNLSGVYLYAAAISALPLVRDAVQATARAGGRSAPDPPGHMNLYVLAAFAAYVAAVAAATSGLASLL